MLPFDVHTVYSKYRAGFASTIFCFVFSSRFSFPIFHLICFSCLDCDFGQHQCDFGTCIDKQLTCNGRVDCPDDNSDERNCPGKDPADITWPVATWTPPQLQALFHPLHLSQQDAGQTPKSRVRMEKLGFVKFNDVMVWKTVQEVKSMSKLGMSWTVYLTKMWLLKLLLISS